MNHEETVLSSFSGWWTEGGPRVPPEALCMFSQSGTSEAPKDQGSRADMFLKNIMANTKDVVRLLQHLPPQMYHAPCTHILGT